MPEHPTILIEGTPRPAPTEDGAYITQERWNKIVENSNRADKLTGVSPVSSGGWETVAVILMDEIDRLQAEKGIVEVQRDAARLRDNAKLVSSLEGEVKQLWTIVKAQEEIIDWYEIETDRDNALEEDVSLDLRELETALEAAEAKGGK